MDIEKYLETYYERQGQIYKCIAVCEHPTVILENVKTGEQETHVIGCLNYNEFTHLMKEKND